MAPALSDVAGPALCGTSARAAPGLRRQRSQPGMTARRPGTRAPARVPGTVCPDAPVWGKARGTKLDQAAAGGGPSTRNPAARHYGMLLSPLFLTAMSPGTSREAVSVASATAPELLLPPASGPAAPRWPTACAARSA